MRSGDELAGKVALVTGGARNIGRAISRALAAGGASVMVTAKSSRAEAEKTVGMLGGKGALHIADVTQPDEVKALVEVTVKRFGRLDFLVNNAAVRFETSFEKMKYEEWRQVLAIVLDGAFLCAQAALPHLIRAGGGTIINIGGQTGHKGAAERAHVITAKAGLAGMTKALALDLAPH
jgi:3-oxoacyl-[acyl-carrier protein] reductase